MGFNDRGGGRGGGGRGFGGRGGSGGGGRGGGGGGFRGRGGGGRGGGGGNRFDQGPPNEVIEVGHFTHSCENDLVCKTTVEKIPYFNAPIFFENKEQIGKIDEIFGSFDDNGFSVKLSEGLKAATFKKDQKLYIDPFKLLPKDRFNPDNKSSGGGRGRGARGGSRGGSRGGARGGGGGFGGRGGGGRGASAGGRGGGWSGNRDSGGGGRGGGFGGRGNSGGFRGSNGGGAFKRSHDGGGSSSNTPQSKKIKF